MTSAEQSPEIIGREILRLDAEWDRYVQGLTSMGKARRHEVQHRSKALRWALHVSLTADTSRPPGTEVEAFLGALKGQEGASDAG